MEKNSNTLIDELYLQCEDILKKASELEHLPEHSLKARPNSKSWNVLECLEHMNLYGDYYLTEIERCIKTSKYEPEVIFKSGWFGNYAVNSMLPKKNGSTNWPMKTFPKMDPYATNLSTETIKRFIIQMNAFLELLQKSKTVSLTKTKCTLTIKWLKFNLGDTLRFMISHNYRHMLQVRRILAEVG